MNEGAPCIWVYEDAGVSLEERRYKNEHPVYYENWSSTASVGTLCN
jgi:thiaminase